jgi:putative hemolysin
LEEDPLLGPLILQLLLILVNALFACAEIAIISINDNKLERMSASGDKRAKRLSELVGQPAKFLATIQIGITLAGFLGSAFAADNFSDRLVSWLIEMGVPISEKTLDSIAVVAITIVLSFFTLVLGELVPKRIAMQKAESLGLAMSGMIYFISKAFAPVVWLLTKSTNGLLLLLQIDPHAQSDEVSEEEIRMMVDVGSEKGAIDEDEKYLINNVFEFDDKDAEEIMTHRTEVSMLWLEESDEEWSETIIQSRHSCYPICGESADDIVGILYSKDYFRLKDRSRDIVMEKAVRQPQFIPESVHADVLFKNMKKSRNHFAVVLDAYGGMSGVVTMSDLLELIVGDLEDDISVPEEQPLIERIDSKTWRVSGSAPLDEVALSLNIKLPEHEYDTFAGMVLGLLGTVPDDGQTPEIEEFGLAIKVTEIKEHRLENTVVAVLDKH